MNAAFADFLFVTTCVVYTVAAILFGLHLAGADRGPPAGRLAPKLVAVGVVLHASHIVVSSLVLRICPVEGMHFAMSVVSMLAGAVYLAARVRFRIDVVGAFVTPVALTFLLASRWVGTAGQEPSNKIKSAILPLHVAVNLLGDALFLLAFAAAVTYLVQERRLKTKRLAGLFQRLPPLDALDKAEHRFLLLGFPLLTLGILTGTLWARRVELGSSADQWRAAFGYATWVLFAGVLFLRAVAGWRGRRAAYGTIAGFGLAVIVLALYLWRSVAPAPVALEPGAARPVTAALDRGAAIAERERELDGAGQ
ncbi:MAG: cytochrome c biogenesis protein CcsA [Myxococcales bacterium]|nr:cytochrome c biogenesis protein CcsA [Myxococcales bacterium]